MVLESLVDVEEARKHPSRLFFLSILGTLIAIILSTFLKQSGLFLVFLVVLAILPLTIKQLSYEEKRREYDFFWEYLYKLGFFQRHKELILSYLYIILGISLTISLSYLLLPPKVHCGIFSDQITTVYSITEKFPEECRLSKGIYTPKVTGNLVDKEAIFFKILTNNLGVIFVCFIFSLFYSSGAIFLISWNASVLGVVVGQGAKEMFGIASIPFILLSYLPHGIPEFLGYITAGIAGGILSIALARHKENRKHFLFVLKDSMLLLSVSIVFILIGSIIEVSLMMP